MTRGNKVWVCPNRTFSSLENTIKTLEPIFNDVLQSNMSPRVFLHVAWMPKCLFCCLYKMWILYWALSVILLSYKQTKTNDVCHDKKVCVPETKPHFCLLSQYENNLRQCSFWVFLLTFYLNHFALWHNATCWVFCAKISCSYSLPINKKKIYFQKSPDSFKRCGMFLWN